MRYLLIVLLLPALLWAQEYVFQQEWDSVQVSIGDYALPAAWTGGYEKSCPGLCDIDADGDNDLMLGWNTGVIDYWENSGTSSQFTFNLAAQKFQGIDLGFWAVIELIDIDSDGDFDLFADRGNYPMCVYKNIGTIGNPQFTVFEDTLFDNLGNYIDGTDFSLIDIDSDGDADLFTGIWYTGGIKYYQNIGDSNQYNFTLVTTSFSGITTGEWCSPTFCDLDADQDYDLFIGDYYGHIRYWRNDGDSVNYNYTFVTNNYSNIDVGDYASPEFTDMDGDGDYDLWVGREAYNTSAANDPGDVYYYENIGTPNVAQFRLELQNSLTLDAGHGCGPLLIDDDDDGDQDLWYSNGRWLSWFAIKDQKSLQSFLFSIMTF